MSKWEEEFIEMYGTTGKLREYTKQWKRINKKEAEKVKKMLERFK